MTSRLSHGANGGEILLGKWPHLQYWIETCRYELMCSHMSHIIVCYLESTFLETLVG